MIILLLFSIKVIFILATGAMENIDDVGETVKPTVTKEEVLYKRTKKILIWMTVGFYVSLLIMLVVVFIAIAMMYAGS
jgi:hypothetical protein